MNEILSSAAPVASRVQVAHDEISRRAQQRWESAGRPDGRDAEFWLEAERELSTPPTAVITPATTTARVETLPLVSNFPAQPGSKKTATPRKSAARISSAPAR